MKIKIIIILVSIILLAISSISIYAKNIGKIELVTGDVMLYKGDAKKWTKASKGNSISDNDAIVTKKNGNVVFTINGKKIKLSSGKAVKMATLVNGNVKIASRNQTSYKTTGEVGSVAGARASKIEGADFDLLPWIEKVEDKVQMSKFEEYINDLFVKQEYIVISSVLKKYCDNNPNDKNLKLKLAEAQYLSAMYTECAESCQTLLNDNVFREKALFLYGAANANNAEYDEAIKTLKEFENSFGNSKYLAEARYLIGLSYKAQSKNDEAKEYLNKALESNPDSELKDMIKEAM